jgi:type I restriction enzyme S subunit
VPQLTAPKVAEYYIPLPPLSEQKRIAEILSQIDQAIEKEEKYKEKLEHLKQGLMQDLLTGKVRVNHLIEEGAENVST